MSKTLTITWDNTVPQAECGYQVFYRRNADTSYTQLNSSGSTSGTTELVTHVDAPACFEGYIVADCCSGSTSVHVPFGINSESSFTAEISVNMFAEAYQLTVTSIYPNPYDTIISGSFIQTVGIIPHTIVYSGTYNAGETSQVITLDSTVISLVAPLSAFTVNAANAVFDDGGELQQLDSISTPPYFRFYWDGTSGSTWNGSPASLPSFLLTTFNITEVDEFDNTLQGALLISWIYGNVFGGGVSPYDRVTLEVYDGGSNLIGSVLFSTATVGLRNSSITLNRSSITYPLTAGQEFSMVAKWDDETVIDTHAFYLPLP